MVAAGGALRLDLSQARRRRPAQRSGPPEPNGARGRRPSSGAYARRRPDRGAPEARSRHRTPGAGHCGRSRHPAGFGAIEGSTDGTAAPRRAMSARRVIGERRRSDEDVPGHLSQGGLRRHGPRAAHAAAPGLVPADSAPAALSAGQALFCEANAIVDWRLRADACEATACRRPRPGGFERASDVMVDDLTGPVHPQRCPWATTGSGTKAGRHASGSARGSRGGPGPFLGGPSRAMRAPRASEAGRREARPVNAFTPALPQPVEPDDPGA